MRVCPDPRIIESRLTKGNSAILNYARVDLKGLLSVGRRGSDLKEPPSAKK
jgi:hypothetical protein